MTKIEMRKLREQDKDCLERLNDSIFSIKYESSFYRNLFSSQNCYAFIFVRDTILGTVTFSVNFSNAYIFTFGILPEFRNKGIGSICWKEIEAFLKGNFDCREISLNVHSTNMKAIDFYLKRGFRIDLLIPDYYLDITPSSSYLMKKSIEN